MDLVKRLYRELQDYLVTNPSRVVPYHNNAHMETVWDIANNIWREEIALPASVRNDVTAYPDPDARVSLMLAAMLHDYGHSAGEKPDDVNIEVAVAALQDFYSRSKVIGFLEKEGMITEALLRNAISAIRITEFPFIHQPTTLIHKVLRDADLLYTAVRAIPEIVLEDLRSEMQVRMDRPISISEMLVGQKAFLDNAKLFTVTGQAMWNKLAQPFYDAMSEYATHRK